MNKAVPAEKNDDKANEDVDASYIENSKDYHEDYQPAAEVPDVLCFQAFKFLLAC